MKPNADIDSEEDKPCYESLLGNAELFISQNDGCNQQGKLEPNNDIVIKYDETCLITESTTQDGNTVYTTQLCKSFPIH